LAVTRNTQPCLFAMDLAAAAALREGGVEADGAAGFSLGEIAGLAFCGLLPAEDAFSLPAGGPRRWTAARRKPRAACSPF
jgi:[acyl-carrier-protein] S-malonyltransferase